MQESPNVNNIQEVNQDMLGQSPTIGGVINTAAFDPIQFAPQEPAQAIPQKYTANNINAPTKKKGEDDFESAISALENNNYATKDSNTKYGGVGAYDADYTGIYYDRYADMKNVFNKYGFSPWRDNESLYNANSGWTDNFKRSLNNSMSLAGLSFKGALPWNAWSSEISKEDAIAQERAFARGYDSRGGFGSFMNNQVLNSGFTVGILAEFGAEALVEGAISLAAAPETGGTSLVLLADIGRKGYNAIKAIDKGIDVAKISQRISKSVEALKDINVSRKFYNAINAERLGKALTPNLVDEIREMQKMSRAGESLTGLAQVSRGVGAFYKDMRIAAAAVSESKMEAGSVELKIRDEITQEFFKENGRMPNAEEQSALAIKAHEGALSTFWYNLPAIYLSNKIVFDKAFSSIKPMRLSADALENASTRYGIEMTEAGFKEYEKGIRASLSRMTKGTFWKPQNLTKNVLTGLGKYTKANVTEGLQEQYQEGVSDAFVNYYRDQYFNPFATGTKMSYLATGMGKQFTTTQGWETFASGFIMGGMMQGPQYLAFTKGSQLGKRIFQKEKYEKAKEQEKDMVAQMVTALNETDSFIKKYSKGEEQANAAIQIRNSQDLATATEKQNKRAYIDIIDDSLSNHFYTLAATGKLSVMQDQIKDYMKMDADELRQAFGIEETGDAAVEKAHKKLNDMLEFSKNIEARYKVVDQTYYNPFNPMRVDFKKDPIAFMKEIQNQRAFEDAKKMAVMSSYHYDRTVERMKSLYEKAANTPVANALAQDFQVLYGTDKAMSTEIHNLKEEVKNMSASINLSPLDKKSLATKKKKLEDLENFTEAKAHYQTVLQKGDAAAIEKASQELYNAYKKYASTIANGLNEDLFDNKLQASFRDLLDFYQLGDDKSQLAESVNLLNNPEGIRYATARLAKAREVVEANRQEELKKALDAFKEQALLNNTLNKLLDLGLFIDEPQMKDLQEGKEVTKFYEMGNELEPLAANSDKYLKAVAIVQAYRLEKGFITPETIQEQQKQEEQKQEEQKVSETTAVPVEPIVDQKADIERRRQEELKERKQNVIVKIDTYEGLNDAGELEQYQIRTDGKGQQHIFTKTSNTINGDERWVRTDSDFKQEVPVEKVLGGLLYENIKLVDSQDVTEHSSLEKINAKYDAELEALEKVDKTDIKSLEKKGFRPAFIDTLSPEEIEDIFKNNLTQAQVQAKRTAAEVEAKDAEIKAAQKERQKLTERFVADIEAAESEEELNQITADIINYSTDSYDFDIVQNAETKKILSLKEKNKELSFDKLNDGDLVYLRGDFNSKDIYAVRKLANGFRVYKQNEKDNPNSTLYKPEEVSKIIYAKAGMKMEDIKTEITPEAKAVAEENVNNSKEISKDEKLAEIKAAQNTSFKDRLKNTKNKKGC